MTDPVREIEHRMAMARPWDHAEENSIWEITGTYPKDRGVFHSCLAQALPHFVTGGHVLFKVLGALATGDGFDVVVPSQISRARPLLLVHRDSPDQPYYESDRVWFA